MIIAIILGSLAYDRFSILKKVLDLWCAGLVRVWATLPRSLTGRLLPSPRSSAGEAAVPFQQIKNFLDLRWLRLRSRHSRSPTHAVSGGMENRLQTKIGDCHESVQSLPHGAGLFTVQAVLVCKDKQSVSWFWPSTRC